MKIIVLFIFAVLLVSIIVHAENDTTLSDAKQTLENIKDTGKNLAGSIPTEKINPIAEQISYILTGEKLDFGWQFAIVIFFWIVLFLIINGVTGTIINKKIFSILAGVIISSLAMHALPEKFIDSIFSSYKSAIYAIVTGIILYVVIIVIKKVFLKRASHGERIEKAEKIGTLLKTSAEIEKEKLESYKDSDKD